MGMDDRVEGPSRSIGPHLRSPATMAVTRIARCRRQSLMITSIGGMGPSTRTWTDNAEDACKVHWNDRNRSPLQLEELLLDLHLHLLALLR